MKAQDRHSDNCPVTVLWGHGKKFEQANGNFLSSSVSHNIFVSCSGLPSLLCLIKPPHQCSYARIFRREHLAHPNQLQGNCPAFSKKKKKRILAGQAGMVPHTCLPRPGRNSNCLLFVLGKAPTDYVLFQFPDQEA